jgi:Fic family protein
MLGQYVARIRALSNTLLMLQYYDALIKIALIKGAHATTAIEGNTLTEKEISCIRMGKSLPGFLPIYFQKPWSAI